jgi:hypothetical protein
VAVERNVEDAPPRRIGHQLHERALQASPLDVADETSLGFEQSIQRGARIPGTGAECLDTQVRRMQVRFDVLLYRLG